MKISTHQIIKKRLQKIKGVMNHQLSIMLIAHSKSKWN